MTGFAVAGFAVAGFAVATGVGFTTAGFAAGEATAAFATGRLRITTTGLLFESWMRAGISVFFPERARKSILLALPSFVRGTDGHGDVCSPFSR